MAAKNLKRVTAYFEPETYERLEAMAKRDKRPLSPMVVLLVEEAMNNREPKADAPNTTNTETAS